MMHDSRFATIIFLVFWGQFSTWRHPIRLGKLRERDLSLFSHSTFERCFVSIKIRKISSFTSSLKLISSSDPTSEAVEWQLVGEIWIYEIPIGFFCITIAELVQYGVWGC